jgi:hypothetical protein
VIFHLLKKIIFIQLAFSLSASAIIGDNDDVFQSENPKIILEGALGYTPGNLPFCLIYPEENWHIIMQGVTGHLQGMLFFSNIGFQLYGELARSVGVHNNNIAADLHTPIEPVVFYYSFELRPGFHFGTDKGDPSYTFLFSGLDDLGINLSHLKTKTGHQINNSIHTNRVIVGMEDVTLYSIGEGYWLGHVVSFTYGHPIFALFRDTDYSNRSRQNGFFGLLRVRLGGRLNYHRSFIECGAKVDLWLGNFYFLSGYFL